MELTNKSKTCVSVVTPTLRRAQEVHELLQNLGAQTLRPLEFILVDGAPEGEEETRHIAEAEFPHAPFSCRYLRHAGGTAIQRNVGIEAARGDLIALIDDDIRLEPGFLKTMVDAYSRDPDHRVGGIVGYRTNEHFELQTRARWRWYRRLKLLTTFEPGRYDFRSGYPINANLQPPFSGVREVDFMTTACAVWRADVFRSGLSFDPFFRGFGVLEDAHFALRARREWTLLQCGDARCRHLGSPNGRVDRSRIGYMCVVNYYYVFRSVAGPLSWAQKLRFWRYQSFELIRIFASGLRRFRWNDWAELGGRLRGALAVWSGRAWRRPTG
jgi:GT2 family glycosyltransferase